MTDHVTAPTPQSLDAGTEYVILERDESGYWREIARGNARSPEAAIRATFPNKAVEGVYVAIPARSFKPVTVRTKTTTTLHLEEAK